MSANWSTFLVVLLAAFTPVVIVLAGFLAILHRVTEIDRVSTQQR